MARSHPPQARPLLLYWRRLVWDRSAVALVEFAYSLPIIAGIGAYGIEVSNYAITHLRVSQIALALADNASRVGASDGLSLQQLREADINDILQGARLQGQSIALGTRGRVTLSSLENVRQSYDAAAVQRIHWQRCFGAKSGSGYDSSYGTASPSAGATADAADQGTAASTGMGAAGTQVSAPEGSGVMFVEINYDYQPLFSARLVTTRISYTASFIVRDKRDFSRIYNPEPTAARASCDQHTA